MPLTPLVPTLLTDLPTRYREQEIHDLFAQLCAGEFAAIVGVGSAGKSNVIKLLARRDVREHHIAASHAAHFIVVELNPHLMGDPARKAGDFSDSWRGYELMLSRLRQTLITEHWGILSQSGEQVILEGIDQDYKYLYDSALAQLGVRHLEHALYKVFSRDPRWRITFLFDEFEQYLKQMPATFFQALRGLRDEYKGRLMYVTASRAPIRTLVEEQYPNDAAARAQLEGFTDLFNGATHYLRLLDPASADFSVGRLEYRQGATLPPNVREQFIQLTGGHAGLLRRGFRAAIGARPETLIDALLNDRGVAEDCETIILSLSSAERAVLRQLVTQQRVSDERAWRSLVNKSITRDAPTGGAWAIPILSAWCITHIDQL